MSNDDHAGNSRRAFVRSTIILGLSGIAMAGSGCSGEEKEEGQKVTPPEDLMQEHGLLNRLLLIYDTCGNRLKNGESFPMEALYGSASIMRAFVEDYHEKQEEDYLFPRFRKAHQMEDLVDILLRQHNAGRAITDQVLRLSQVRNQADTEKQQLIQLLASFNTMYRPHEAREDTILFPAFRKIVSSHEYDSLGEEFEKNEEKKFGKDGFAREVDKIAAIEKSLGIYDLDKFTPGGSD